MVKPNYAFAKRQRDLAKKAAKEEKKQKKAAINETPQTVAEAQPAAQPVVPAKATE